MARQSIGCEAPAPGIAESPKRRGGGRSEFPDVVGLQRRQAKGVSIDLPVQLVSYLPAEALDRIGELVAQG